MSFHANFKDILNEKIKSKESLNSPEKQAFERENIKCYSPEKDLDPMNLAFLMGQIHRSTLTIGRGKYPAPKVRPQRKPHNLSNLQQQSFAFVKKWIHDFSEAFTEGELKKAYRQAALILHPDQGGNVQDFLELKKHIEILKGILKPV